MQAGTPTPRKAAPAIARPGTSLTAARIASTRSGWPTRYCGRPPPQRTRRVSSGSGRDRPEQVGDVGDDGGGQVVVGPLQLRLVAEAADRRAHQQRVAAGRCGHFADETVTPLTSRPATGGTSSPEPASTSWAGKAIATTAIDA